MPRFDPIRRLCQVAYVLLLTTHCAHALILYSGDNAANQAAPDATRQDAFDSVGRVAGAGRGSVIHLRGKYLLTADHVNVNTNQISFDGNAVFARDTAFAPVQIGSSDMKLIKLIIDPGLPETALFDDLLGDVATTATLIGWGVGRDPGVADSGAGSTNIWQWGNTSTMAKRWGTNFIQSANTGKVAGYTYDYLLTVLNRNSGSNEAGAALYDSGSGLFVEDGGVWKLAGLTSAVTSINGPDENNPDKPRNATFGNGLVTTSDLNFFVRISSYVAEIEAAIPDTRTLSGWKIDHSLYGADAADDADTDFDGIPQILEFALGGDPNVNDIGILPTHALVEDGGLTYLELIVTRPIGLQGITYIPETTTDLNNWPADSTGDFVDATPTQTDNGDGTETLVYRRSQAVSGVDQAFVRIDVREN